MLLFLHQPSSVEQFAATPSIDYPALANRLSVHYGDRGSPALTGRKLMLSLHLDAEVALATQTSTVESPGRVVGR